MRGTRYIPQKSTNLICSTQDVKYNPEKYIAMKLSAIPMSVYAQTHVLFCSHVNHTLWHCDPVGILFYIHLRLLKSLIAKIPWTLTHIFQTTSVLQPSTSLINYIYLPMKCLSSINIATTVSEILISSYTLSYYFHRENSPLHLGFTHLWPLVKYVMRDCGRSSLVYVTFFSLITRAANSRRLGGLYIISRAQELTNLVTRGLSRRLSCKEEKKWTITQTTDWNS